jgi:hypothetical protein
MLMRGQGALAAPKDADGDNRSDTLSSTQSGAPSDSLSGPQSDAVAAAAARDLATLADSQRASAPAQSTTVYPRLSLGQFQRHASKGAYIVRLGRDPASAASAETEWLIP